MLISVYGSAGVTSKAVEFKYWQRSKMQIFMSSFSIVKQQVMYICKSLKGDNVIENITFRSFISTYTFRLPINLCENGAVQTTRLCVHIKIHKPLYCIWFQFVKTYHCYDSWKSDTPKKQGAKKNNIYSYGDQATDSIKTVKTDFIFYIFLHT